MYAIVDISGKQFKVEKNKFIYTDKIDSKDGKKVEFNNVLFISEKGKIKIGKPTIKGSKVTGEVLSQLKDDKVIVFKKKRLKLVQEKLKLKAKKSDMVKKKIPSKKKPLTTKKK